jgi:hypothetical protein
MMKSMPHGITYGCNDKRRAMLSQGSRRDSTTPSRNFANKAQISNNNKQLLKACWQQWANNWRNFSFAPITATLMLQARQGVQGVKRQAMRAIIPLKTQAIMMTIQELLDKTQAIMMIIQELRNTIQAIMTLHQELRTKIQVIMLLFQGHQDQIP